MHLSSSSNAYFLRRAQERASLPLRPGFWASSPPAPDPKVIEDIIYNSAVQRARREVEAAAQQANAEQLEEPVEQKTTRRRDRSEKSKSKKKKKKEREGDAKERRRKRKEEKKNAKRAKTAGWESNVDYGKALLPGEAEGYARFVQENKRIPRRGEIGLTAEQIVSFERSGYVMSGARHERMNAVRERKEGQIYSAEEERALAIMKRQKQQETEQELIHSLKVLANQQELQTSLIKFVPRV